MSKRKITPKNTKSLPTFVIPFVPDGFVMEGMPACCGMTIACGITLDDFENHESLYEDYDKGFTIYSDDLPENTIDTLLEKKFIENTNSPSWLTSFEVIKDFRIKRDFLQGVMGEIDHNFVRGNPQDRHTIQMNIIDEQIEILGGLTRIRKMGWKKVYRFQNAGANGNWITTFMLTKTGEYK